MTFDEGAIIHHIRARFPGGADLHDDCGLLPEPLVGERLLVTTDVMESGQHFRLDWHPPRLLGRKLLAVNLSDLDASGARPLGFTLTLALGREVGADWILELLEGLAEGAEAAGIPVLGGDTVGRAEGVGLGVTAYGTAARWLRRDHVRSGDRLYVDQPLGASLRGLRKLQAGQRWDPAQPDPDLAAHLDPRPHLGLGRRLADLREVHACIDLSDGLSRDLRMLAEASGVSVRLASDLAEDELRGGEDYARCFASDAAQADLEARLGLGLRCVGQALERGSAPLLYDGGQGLRPLPDLSFDHFAPEVR
ncbi:MAG TPA: AIR synthase related protein [Holophaga sp.]|nr:AIR synthase related protein [Holophaga sp.]